MQITLHTTWVHWWLKDQTRRLNTQNNSSNDNVIPEKDYNSNNSSNDKARELFQAVMSLPGR